MFVYPGGKVKELVLSKKLGSWLQKPFSKSRKAVRKSGAKGRKGRAKSPF
jgi:hypothetical protein